MPHVAIYFLATEENEIQNRTAFQNIVAEQTGNELLMNVRADSWDMIFKAWVDADGTSGEKRIMIIDEFQYIIFQPFIWAKDRAD